MTTGSELGKHFNRTSAESFATIPLEVDHEINEMVSALIGQADLVRAIELYGSVDAIAHRMADAVPDAVFTDPPIGPCYSATALARWRQLSRQAIDQQRKAGRLFGVMLGRRWHYPSAQFDRRGRQSHEFAVLLAGRNASDPVEFAVWLENADPETGISPRLELQQAAFLARKGDFFDGFVPTIIDPPLRAVPANSETDR